MKNPLSVHWNSHQYSKFNSLIFDYLNQQSGAVDLYHRFPDENSILDQSAEKIEKYKHRQILHAALEQQLSSFDLTAKQKENFHKLSLPETVTITTGHQLNLFTGPLFFFNKILQLIKCCDEMNQKHKTYNFVPVFWMATEDHDFEEINHFFFRDKKISWNRQSGGAVGRMDLNGIDEVFDEFFDEIEDSDRKDELKKIVNDTYLNSKNLTEATQKLVQLIFADRGLLMIDGDDRELKKLMIPVFETDLFEQTAFRKISETNQKMIEKGYPVQVNPREINLFYLGDGSIRERIVFEDGKFKVLNSDYEFSKEEIRKELYDYPEKFSPNVILRPIYQETVLPNIAYIGGAGESAYWLQLKSFFDEMKIPFPLVIVRNTVLLLSSKQHQKLEKLGISYKELMEPLNEIINQNITQNSTVEIDFEAYENSIQKIFDELTEKAVQTDITFSKMVDAQRTKQLKGLDKLKKRLLRAEKRKYAERVGSVKKIYNELFPQNNLQERVVNFSELYLEYGFDFMDEIIGEIKPIEFCFSIKTVNK